MNPTTKKWLTGCGIGCGSMIVLGILVTVGGSLFLMGPFREAIETRQQLDEQYGGQADYAPPADGAVAADRVEAFLAVRGAVMDVCPEFEATAAQFRRMDELGEDAPDREAMGEGLKLTREVFGMVPRMGRLFEARNGTLAEVGMGLGEYTYIYVMAYGGRIATLSDSESEPFGGAAASGRVRRILREMLLRQLAALEAAEAGGAVFGELHEHLAGEVELLEADSERLPWQDGRPAALEASLEPFAARLDSCFCAATASLELSQNQQRGLSIQSD